MNTVNIVGKILENPEKSVSSSGVKLARFKIGVEKNKEDSTAIDVFEVVVFRELADADLQVGQYVGVTGKLSSNNYEKDGKKYYNCSLVGNSLSLCTN